MDSPGTRLNLIEIKNTGAHRRKMVRIQNFL
jgi:hypothetical protein